MAIDLSGSAAFTAYIRDLGLAELLPIFEVNSGVVVVGAGGKSTSDA